MNSEASTFMRFLFATLLLLPPVVAVADEKSPAHAGIAPLTDIIIGGFEQPLRIRLVAGLDGVGWRQHFDRTHQRRVVSLFDQLDADDDGRLTQAEAKRLPSSDALGRAAEGKDVYVAFNFRVLDADGDGGATLAELAEYAGDFGEQPIRLVTAEPGSVARARNLFDLLDADGDEQLVADEWSDLDALLDRDRDGNRVLTNNELQSLTASVFGPEFVAVPLARGSSSRKLTYRIAAPTRSPADVTLFARFPKPSIELAVSAAAKNRGVRVMPGDRDTVVVQYQERRFELRLVPPILRRNEEMRRAILREYKAVRSRGKVTRDVKLPPVLKSIFPVADGDANGELVRSEIEACLDGFIAAKLAAESSQLRLTVFGERRGLATLVDRNLDGRLGLRELSRLPRELDSLAGTRKGVTRDDVPATVSIVLQRGPFDHQTGPELMLNAGPSWFFRADRNQDGDLDQDEFLGSSEVFGRIDANGDGWIDLHEAVRGDTLFP